MKKIFDVIGDIAVVFVSYFMLKKIDKVLTNNEYGFNFYLFLVGFIITVCFIVYRVYYIAKNKRYF
jgi:hypothetical protein